MPDHMGHTGRVNYMECETFTPPVPCTRNTSAQPPPCLLCKRQEARQANNRAYEPLNDLKKAC